MGLERFLMPLLAELRKLFLGGALLQRCRPVTGAPEALNRWVGRSGISQPIADKGGFVSLA